MISIGLERSKYDYCLYYYKEKGCTIYVILYVDDLLILGSNIVIIKRIKKKLSNRFKMKDLGQVK